MKITDANLLEKMFSTFRASNLLQQQQYREQRFRKYFELISSLSMAEKNNKLLLRKAHYDWMHYQLQDFKSFIQYNYALFKIVSQLKLCGVEITDAYLLEKTFSTFHASNLLLQQQY